MVTRRQFVQWTAAAAAPISVHSSPSDLSLRVDQAIESEMHVQRIPGLSLAVARKGVLLKATGYGVCNLELKTPTTPQSVYLVNSMGKQWTAAGILLLVEDGKVALDDVLAKYFSEVRPAWQAVTIRHLLTHTSGIPDLYGETAQRDGHGIDLRRDYTEDELARIYTQWSLDFTPGEKWSYCNTGYELLGFLIHRITGEFYADYLHRRIFAPLGMQDTRIFSWADVIANRASGYERVDGGYRNGAWESESLMSTADGGIVSTVVDFAKWDAALYTDKILSKRSRDSLWTPVKLNSGSTYAYGLGWNLSAAKRHRVYWHSGGGSGFSSNISRYVDDALTFIILTNLDETATDVVKVAAKVASIYLPETQGANPVKN